MTRVQQEAARERYQRESEVCCPLCEGTGRILSQTVKARAKKGGNATFLKSLMPGQMSMSERGKKGGRPKALTLADLGLRDGVSDKEATRGTQPRGGPGSESQPRQDSQGHKEIPAHC